MDQSEEALAVVESWWKKSFDISKQSNDPLHSLFTTGFETIMIYLSQSIDYEYTQSLVKSLDEQRKLALQSEDKNDVLRDLSFGMMEVVQKVMLRDTRKLEEMIKSGYIRVPEIQNLPFPLLELKEEEIDDVRTIPEENKVNVGDREDPIKDRLTGKEEEETEETVKDTDNAEKISTPQFSVESIEDSLSILHDNQSILDFMEDFNPKKEDLEDTSLNNSVHKSLSGDTRMEESNGNFSDEIDAILAGNLSVNNGDVINDNMYPLDDIVSKEYSPNDQSMEEKVDGNEDPPPNLAMKEGKKSSRKKSRPLKYKDSIEDSDEEKVEPTMKKSRVGSDSKQKTHSPQVGQKMKYSSNKSTSKSNADKPQITKISNNQLECPECEYRCNSVCTWMGHLRTKHSTTPTLSGLALLCQCGHESTSEKHSILCNFSHCKVIRKNDNPIRRIEEVTSTQVKCILCESYSKTPRGYIAHLERMHREKPTLKSNEIYILCECGFKIPNSDTMRRNHKECHGRQYTIHKLKAEVHSTLQCILCKICPKKPISYINHLRSLHKDKSSLAANGIYLKCSCGFEIRSANNKALQHDKDCHSLQFTLHHITEEEVHSTPQCILCKAYPKTPSAYTDHLYTHHKDKPTLTANSIYLLCECGREIRCSAVSGRHSKECHGLQYTLHKVDDQ